MLKKIISGGQTGVDRAALDSARLQTAFSWGGWCPKGRLAEDGQLGEEYFVGTLGSGMEEADSSRPQQRTRFNVRDSDATLIVRSGRVLSPGTKLTIKLLRVAEKPYRICDPFRIYTVPRVVQWICQPQQNGETIETLNVAGPREQKVPGIYERSLQYLTDIFHLVALYQRHGIEIWNPKRRNNEQQNPID